LTTDDASSPAALPARDALRRRLLEARAAAAGGPDDEAAAALGRALRSVIAELEPQCLGLYWPHRSEFNAPAALADDEGLVILPCALPYARRTPPQMEYRAWDLAAPRTVDECGIAASDGPVVVPDVVLVPCVGYTAAGHRGGYFDRWLAAHPQVCAVGVAWADARIDEAELAPQPHDVRMTLIVTEAGVV
jgi:5-formyltetrahydrofolate cyclo-ligase